MKTIKELLDELSKVDTKKAKELVNSKETWSRIGSKDSFKELGLTGKSLESYLRKWCDENPYNNL